VQRRAPCRDWRREYASEYACTTIHLISFFQADGNALHRRLPPALLNSLLPLPQLKKVYTTLAPGTTSSLLLPYIKQALDSAHDSSLNGNHNGHHSNTSPFMRHRRSFTSASSLSTMSRCSGNGDSLLSKFVLLQSSQNDERSLQAIKELRQSVCEAYIGSDAISKDLAETDFESLFPRLEVSGKAALLIIQQTDHLFFAFHFACKYITKY
jgi:hypothetical protein